MARLHLQSETALFEVIFYVEEDPDLDGHFARILRGADAQERLAVVMSSSEG